MKYLVLLLLIPALFYTVSYIGYNWNKKNRKAAFGMIIMATASIAFPLLILYLN